MDQVDKAILEILQRDCSISYANLAHSVSLSVNACHRRVKLLEEQGVIQRRVAIVDKEKAGITRTVVLFVKLHNNSGESSAEIFEFIKDDPQVAECYQLIGAQDIFVRIDVKTDVDFNNFYKALFDSRKVSGILACPAIARIKDETAISMR